MVLKRWWKSKTTISLSIGKATFEAHGDQQFVERALEQFLATTAKTQENRQLPCQDIVLSARPEPYTDRRPQAEAGKHVAQLLEAEDTEPSAPPKHISRDERTQVVRRRTRPARRSFIRLHAIDGEISKVYAMNENAFAHSVIGQNLDVQRIGNIYCEDSVLAKRFKRTEHETLWYSLMSKANGQG